MLQNRSVPVDTLLPHIFYSDVAAAIVWLTKVFGFSEHFRYAGSDGAIQGAQLYLGEAWIMIAITRPGRSTPSQLGERTQSLSVFLEEVDAHFTKAKAAGATIIEELHETIYGERQYAAEDLEGHHWIFAKHAQDVSPETWGAILGPQSKTDEI